MTPDQLLAIRVRIEEKLQKEEMEFLIAWLNEQWARGYEAGYSDGQMFLHEAPEAEQGTRD